MPKTFGQFLKEKRLALGLSLREFAKRVGMQPSNYCNVEADVLPPPPAETLDRLAKALGLKKGASDYETFHDLAAEGRDEIPSDVGRIVKENELIPAMLRTVEYEQLSKEQLRGIIEDLRSGRYTKAQPKC
ncbi:MAG: transcriptional regulator [Verrucomicrobia bacterium]|nr:transcriptional regulator [Verrucomicrobiota bacterium]